MMGGLDWHALPTVCAILGISDLEALVFQLIKIRDHHRAAGES